MESEAVWEISLESRVNCLECQHLYQPNPEEDVLICLRTLGIITHEIEDILECWGFEELKDTWTPVYLPEIAGIM